MNIISKTNITTGKTWVGEDKKVAIVISRFNDFLTTNLLIGACDTLNRMGGVPSRNIDVFYVPGAFEIPLIVQKLARQRKYAGIIALGAVIRGATPHFDHLSAKVISDVGALALQENVPVSFGVLTVNDIDQAIERSGTKAGNKGNEAALAVLEMISLVDLIESHSTAADTEEDYATAAYIE